MALTACSSIVMIPAKYQSYTDDISVSTALTLAQTSYSLGCVDAFKAANLVQHANATCHAWAKKNVSENILEILDAKAERVPSK